MIPDSKDYEKAAMESLRIGLRYYVGRLGTMGVVHVIREIVYILQDDSYGGFPAFLESVRNYAAQEGDRS